MRRCPADLAEMFAELCDGTIGEDRFRALNARLETDAEARRLYAEYIDLHDALGRRWAEAAPLRSAVRPGRARLRLRVAALAVGLAAAVVLVVLFRPSTPAPTDQVPNRPSPQFASLVAARDAVWADPNVDLALGAGQLPDVELRLDAGAAEFLLSDGATVVARGPAVVRFPARGRVAVDAGRVFCRCPTPDSRVVVETPAGEVVDLGTEFAVEARADRTARVAVVSGEVRVGSAGGPALRKGEAAEVRADGQLVVRPLAANEMAELLRTAPPAGNPMPDGKNLLRDPEFDLALSPETWGGTQGHLSADSGGRTGGGVRVTARGFAAFPLCRQTVPTGNIGGKLVMASATAAVAKDDPLKPGQFAGLKIVFLDADGREFGFAKRHLLTASPVPGQFEPTRLAAVAPPGTAAVSVQLILYAGPHRTGAVVFDDASLIIADLPATPDVAPDQLRP